MEFCEQICPVCFKLSLGGWTHERCKSQLDLDGLIAIWSYKNEVVRSVVEEIKFGFNRELIEIILRKFSFESGVVFDYLVPMPLHKYRENWRGFNQAELIAFWIGKKMKVSVEKVLRRRRNTKQQAMIKRAVERKRNIRGAFSLGENFSKKNLKGKKVLLVDDVFTSGESMRECAKILKRNGVEKVWGLVLAR
jgi:ComF family protein